MRLPIPKVGLFVRPIAQMSIVTRTGDLGSTTLMYQRRVPKDHPRVEACGTVDELTSALGVARALLEQAPGEKILAIQKDLIALMGELATAAEDLPRYLADGFARLGPGQTARLEQQIRELESAGTSFHGWAIPGESPGSAALDLARTMARRAERRVCAVQAGGDVGNPEVIVYLNRLSDLLWLMARAVDTKAG